MSLGAFRPLVVIVEDHERENGEHEDGDGQQGRAPELLRFANGCAAASGNRHSHDPPSMKRKR